MDLFCPHCTRRVTIPDDQAGLVTNCPLCAKQFMAPTLAPPPAPPKPPPPPPAAPPKLEGAFTGAPAAPPTPTAPASSTPAPSAPPPPPPPPGDYTRSCVCYLSDTWLPFVTPACVVLIFVLSFLHWHNGAMLWVVAFSYMTGHMIAYIILMFLTFPLVIVALIFDKGWVVAPPQLAMVITFKNVIVGLMLGLSFLMLCFDYLYGNFFEAINPIEVPMKIAFRLHFVALIASFLMFWLSWRKRSNLPWPKFEMRW